MPTERERKIDFLAFEELIARLVESTSETRCNGLSLDLLRIRNGHHLDPGRLERVKIEWHVPMARFQQRNFHPCSPSAQVHKQHQALPSLAANYSEPMSAADFPSGT